MSSEKNRSLRGRKSPYLPNLYRQKESLLKKSNPTLTDISASGCPMANKSKISNTPLQSTNPITNGCTLLPPPSPKLPKPTQNIKKPKFSIEDSNKNCDAENDEEIRALEDEILELQEYNAKVESEMIKLRTDITQMEQQIRMTERDNQSLAQKSHNLNEYYESLRNNFITLLDHVRLPNFDERLTVDNFEIYLKRLQSLCDNGYREENKVVLSSVKQALKDFNCSF